MRPLYKIYEKIKRIVWKALQAMRESLGKLSRID